MKRLITLAVKLQTILKDNRGQDLIEYALMQRKRRSPSCKFPHRSPGPDPSFLIVVPSQPIRD